MADEVTRRIAQARETQATELDLSSCGLTSLPRQLLELADLQRLDVSANKLAELPDWIGDLQNLVELRLFTNGLVRLPESITTLPKLTLFDASYCNLLELPAHIGNLRQLATLCLTANELSRLPESISELNNLTILDVSSNDLHELPHGMHELNALTELMVYNNKFTNLPDSLSQLARLQTLNMSFCPLQQLPDWMETFTDLQILSLSNCSLASLPKWIGNLRKLVMLDVSRNYLTILPESITTLESLYSLYASDNRLTALPQVFGSMPNLGRIEVTGNLLTTLPDTLSDLPNLKHIYAGDNPIASPPPEIVSAGSKSIITFLRARREGASTQWVSKLLVVGEGNVGKTSVVKALAGLPHDPLEKSTHGLRIEHLQVPHPIQPDVQMELSTWDFGGQQIYHATHQFFLTNRSLFLLVWNSRQGWEACKLRYWLDIIKARAPQSPIILVATHPGDRPVDLPLSDLKRDYPQIVASLSVDNESRDGIEELHTLVAEQAANLPLMGAEWPTRWISAAANLMKSGKNYITPRRMWQLMTEAGVEDETQQKYIAAALHELGDILHYKDDPELCQTVVLKPEWVNDYISKVLDSDEVKDRNGLLSREHLNELWADLEGGLYEHFLGMMDKYDLSYRVETPINDVSLVVERLPWDAPDFQEKWGKQSGQEIKVRYELNTMPPGIPTWFIARTHRFSTGTHWRTGAVLEHGDHKALIRADAHHKSVELTVRGPAPAAFFSILDDGLNRTLERYPGLEIKRWVPCTCKENCGELYRYEHLSDRLLRTPPRHTIECRESGDMVNVPHLLLGLAPSTEAMLAMDIEEVKKILTRIDYNVAEQAEYNQRMFMKLQHLAQKQQEASCPSIFALVQTKSRVTSNKFELRLYCEEPGAWHRLPEPHGIYAISQPKEWFQKVGPYLQGMLTILKHAAPLVKPVLGSTVDKLDEQLKSDCDLMKELISQTPDELKTGDELGALSRRAVTEADFRVLQAMLEELDPQRAWGGLSRTTTPEGLTLYLCADHLKAY